MGHNHYQFDEDASSQVSQFYHLRCNFPLVSLCPFPWESRFHPQIVLHLWWVQCLNYVCQSCLSQALGRLAVASPSVIMHHPSNRFTTQYHIHPQLPISVQYLMQCKKQTFSSIIQSPLCSSSSCTCTCELFILICYAGDNLAPAVAFYCY